MMSAQTGRMMPLAEHVRQSIHNILFTRIGTRLQREEYGSLLPILLDAPVNEITLMRCNAAVIMALAKWEPRYTVTAAQTRALTENDSVRVEIALSGSLNGKAQDFIIGVPHG